MLEWFYFYIFLIKEFDYCIFLKKVIKCFNNEDGGCVEENMYNNEFVMFIIIYLLYGYKDLWIWWINLIVIWNMLLLFFIVYIYVEVGIFLWIILFVFVWGLWLKIRIDIIWDSLYNSFINCSVVVI